MPRKPVRRMAKKKPTLAVAIKKQLFRTAEHKYKDTVFDLAPQSNGTIIDMSNILSGDTDETRDGDQIRILKWSMNMAVLAGDQTNLIRCIVFRWNVMSSYKTPLPADILNFAGFPLAVIPTAQYTWDNVRQKQFTVLYDKLFAVSLNAGPAIIAKQKKVYKLGLPVNYEAATANGEGKIYMLFISDSTAGPNPQAIGDFRIEYNDS